MVKSIEFQFDRYHKQIVFIRLCVECDFTKRTDIETRPFPNQVPFKKWFACQLFQAQNSYQWKRWWFNGNAIRLWLQPSLKDVLEFVFWDQTKRPKHTISYKINGECDKYCWKEKKNRIEGKKKMFIPSNWMRVNKRAIWW